MDVGTLPGRRRFAAATSRHDAAGASRSGTVVSHRFDVGAIVGAGPHGTVYEAIDLRTTRRVALKVLDPGIAAARVVRRRAIAHPTLIELDAVERLDDDSVGLSMELVNGVDVASLLAEAPVPGAQALRIVRQALEGVRALHDAGLAHGNLKPENLMLEGIGVVDDELVDDVDEPVRVLDVGLCDLLRNPHPPFDLDQAPPPYVAPEILGTGHATRKADLYAMGVVLAEMLWGEPIAGAVSIRRDWTEQLAFVVWKATQRDPRDRFRDVAEMTAAIGLALRSLERGPRSARD